MQNTGNAKATKLLKTYAAANRIGLAGNILTLDFSLEIFDVMTKRCGYKMLAVFEDGLLWL
jgi:hypothetical protein